MTTTMSYQQPADLFRNPYNLRISNPIPDVSALYEGMWGNEEDEKCAVAVIPKNLFDEDEYHAYRANTFTYPQYLLKILNFTKGTVNVYVIFEEYKSLTSHVERSLGQENFTIFKRIYFKLVQLLQANSKFEKIKLRPEMISLDQDNNPRFVFYPRVGATKHTFSASYQRRHPSIRFDVGVVAYYCQFGVLPEDTNGRYVDYKPPSIFTRELEVIMDRLLHDRWSRKKFYWLGHYILNLDERAFLLARLVRNANPRHDDTRLEPTVTYDEKSSFVRSLANSSFFASNPFSPIVPWLSVAELNTWYTTNQSCVGQAAHMATNRRSRLGQTKSTVIGLLNLLRHTIMHSRRHYGVYVQFFQNLNNSRTITSFTVGDFMSLIQKHYPVFFILIFDKAVYYMPKHKTILIKQ
jgi:hypothetical protein